MRVRSHNVRQPREHAPAATVLVVVVVVVVVAMLMPAIVTMAVMTWVVRGTPIVHGVQHAAEKTLPHLSNYNARVYAN